jgi:sulfur-carrier protein
LQACFAAHPGLGHYILDDQGRIRKHVLLFADGCRLGAATALDHVLEAESELYVMQALSGGQGEPG